MKKKILFLFHSSRLSGAQQSLLQLLERLNRENYIPFVLVPGKGPLLQRIEALGLEWINYSIPWWFSQDRKKFRHFRIFMSNVWDRVSFLRKLIRDKSIDLVYSNTITCIDGGVAAKLEGKPHIWHIHEILGGNTGLHPIVPVSLIPPILRYLSDTIIVPSNAAKKEWNDGDRFGNSIRIIPNGVDLKIISKWKDAHEIGSFHDDLGIPRTTKIVVLIGYFHETKGQAEFVEAAKIVCEKSQDSVFVMVGDGLENNPYSTRLIKRSTELGVRHRIFFFRFREDIDYIINFADIFVIASWVESFSKVICEAMAAAKPVIATKCGGPEEIVLDGETGFLVPKKDPSKLADAIIQLLGNEKKAREMGRMGRKRAEEFYGIEQYVKRIENVIDGVARR